MVTKDEAKEYLSSIGITLPDIIIDALVEQANSIQACLDEHYTPATALLIQLYVIGLMGLGQGDKYISSETSPSGASRSYRYQSFSDRWRGALYLLRGIDKSGCASGLIPPDPTAKAYGALWISRGGCMCNR